ncbi:hypothetical protein BGZ63DRAFT_395207 [Mariannaea sp. PMI_226]|nr:hypothetical protein BGZ63DRAFT_395207 [Mariannaea sp. PMI_226]
MRTLLISPFFFHSLCGLRVSPVCASELQRVVLIPANAWDMLPNDHPPFEPWGQMLSFSTQLNNQETSPLEI